MRFALELVQALARAGAGTEQLEQTTTAIAERVGLENPQVFARPTSITVATGPLGGQRLIRLRVAPSETDLGRLTQLTEVAVDVFRGAEAVEPARARVRAIEARRSGYPAVLALLAYPLASSSIALVLGGSADDAAAAAVVGLATGLVAFAATHARLDPLLAPAAAAVAAFLGGALAVAFDGVSAGLVGLAGIVVFLPGVAITMGLREVSTGQLLSGTGNLSAAGSTLLGLVFGVAVGTGTAERLVGPAPAQVPGKTALWLAVCAAVLAGASLTVRNRAETRDAPWMVVASVLAIVASRFCNGLAGAAGGPFLAALAVGVAGNVFSRLTSRPSLVFVVPGLVMLVPGSAAFRSLSALLDTHVDHAIQAGFDMFIVAIALVYGLLLSNLVLRPRPLR